MLVVLLAVPVAVVVVAVVAVVPRVAPALQHTHTYAAAARQAWIPQAAQTSARLCMHRGGPSTADAGDSRQHIVGRVRDCCCGAHVRARTMKAAPSCLIRQNIHNHRIVPYTTCTFLCHCCTLGIFRPR